MDKIIESLIFDKKHFKTLQDAQKWAESHGFKPKAVEDAGETFKAVVRDPREFSSDGLEAMDMAAGVKAVLGTPSEKLALPPTKSVKGVKIFRPGKWNGCEYSLSDMKGIVAAFKETKDALKPFLKLGHNDGQAVAKRDDLPAVGWVDDLRIEGQYLVADFLGIPAKVFDLIKAGAFRGRSIEIWKNMSIAGKTHPWVLTAVALLGADIPAVDSLGDMLNLFAAKSGEVLAHGQEGDPHVLESVKDQFDKEVEEMKTLEEAKKALAESESKREELEAQVKEKDTQIEALTGERDEARTQVAEFESKADEVQIEAKLNKLVEEKKINPVQKPFLMALMKNLPKGEDSKKFKVGEEELTLDVALEKMLSHNKAGLPDTEETETGKEREKKAPTGETGADLDAKVKAFMKEEAAKGNKLSYKDAMFIVAAEAERSQSGSEDGDE